MLAWQAGSTLQAGSNRDTRLACREQQGYLLGKQGATGILAWQAGSNRDTTRLASREQQGYHSLGKQGATGMLAWQAGSTLHAGSNRDTRLAIREQYSLGNQGATAILGMQRAIGKQRHEQATYL